MNQNLSEDTYYGELVNEDSQSFIETSYDIIKEPKLKKPNLGSILGFGKKKKEKVNPELKENEPYLKVVELCGMTKMPQCHGTLSAKTSVRNLMEKLRHESPFGHGDDSVILCENEIARYLKELEENVQGLFDEEIAKEASEVVIIDCKLIQAKLKIRTELKRK